MNSLRALGKAACVANIILVIVILIFIGIDDFLSRIMGLYGGDLTRWHDLLCNTLLFVVLLAAVLWVAFTEKGK